jgi:hypothetical protein
MMLAIGALLDLDAPPHSYDASHYYQLGRAALSVDSMFEEQSIPAIQALACDLVLAGFEGADYPHSSLCPITCSFLISMVLAGRLWALS